MLTVFESIVGAKKGIKTHIPNIERILETKPILSISGSLEIHCLTCKRDLLMMLWCLKSFDFHHKDLHSYLIHSDGTLDKQDIQLIKDHITNVRIIDLDESTTLVEHHLKEYPSCLDLRRQYSKYPYLLKIFDPYVFSKSNYYLQFDSDLLFFSKSKQIVSYANSKTPFYHGGGWGFLQYPVNVNYLYVNGFKPVGNLNSGILGICRNTSFFDLDLIESYLNKIKTKDIYFVHENRKIELLSDLGGYFFTGNEEPLFSIIMGNSDHRVIWAGPPADFAPSYCHKFEDKTHGFSGQNPKDCAVIHYAGFHNSSNNKQYLNGLSYLINNSPEMFNL